METSVYFVRQLIKEKGLFWAAIAPDGVTIMKKARNSETLVNWCRKNKMKIIGCADIERDNTMESDK